MRLIELSYGKVRIFITSQIGNVLASGAPVVPFMCIERAPVARATIQGFL